MNIDKLIKACKSFEKLAQDLKSKVAPPQKKIDWAKRKEVNLWSNTLFSGFKGTGHYLYSPQQAKKIFDNIAANKNSSLGDPDALKQVNSLLTALTYSEDKLKDLGVNPLTVLKQKGVQNVTPTSLEVLKKNLEILRDGIDFSGYRHYFIAVPGTPKDVIELDDPEIKHDDAGY